MDTKTVKVTMPQNRWDMVKVLESQPNTPQGSPRAVFMQAIAEELSLCMQYAMEDTCLEPSIVFTPANDMGGSQIIAEFSVSDMARANADQYNWHGQNTSRWCYAGAIVYDKEDGKVSRHH